ncbi:hypothetical protein KIW84_055024 [Lathyrus oleraceus]|uniref:PGG domain-containing protein n=1 Tax=Pisum sativum TaxID=3888 RepID=A0A9D4WWY8_PEA|nr:hypothetical protein KIW84_055024 [Pisum sativum]
MYCYEGLIYMKDNDDIIPLEILATRTSAFKSGTRLSWWKQILYYLVRTYPSFFSSIFLRILMNGNNNIAENDDFGEVSIPLYHAEELEKAYNVQHTAAPLHFFSRVKILCNRIQKYVFRWPILSCLNSTMAIKKKHIYGGQLLDEFMKNPYESYIGGGFESISNIDDEFESFSEFIIAAREEGETSTQEKNENKNFEDSTNIDGKNTAYLIAASHGIVEMMTILESRIRSVIHDINSNKENAFHLAVKNRQPHVIQWLMKSLRKEVFHQLNLEVDKNENTILHLAAYTSIQRENNWRISGVAMQLIWDIKWYKYIKGLVPEHFNHRLNVEGKTPSQIFKEQHKELLEKSIKWMNETAQSNSVVATLIAGASFATSASAPSGDQKTSDPTSEGHLAVEGFTISSLIGLYFSVGALIMFLSILSSRKEIEDFRQKLPMKLLFALSSLFVSIVAMFVSFCAGHFSVLSDKYNKRVIVFYLYISISLPIILYAAVQFSLFVDLVMVIWKKVPPPSVKGVHL